MDVELTDNDLDRYHNHHRTGSNELRERKVTFNHEEDPSQTTTADNNNTSSNTVPGIALFPPQTTTGVPTIQLPASNGRPGSGSSPAGAGGRKFSFPAALHANLLGIAGRHSDSTDSHKLSVPGAQDIARRRFSNVSDAVSRKLSTTIIGWRVSGVGGLGAAPVPTEDVIAQGRVLCGQYIRNRLRRSGFYGRKLGLYRLRSTVGTSSPVIARDVFPCLVAVCAELERMHPKLYTNIARQAGRSTPDRTSTSALLAGMGHQLLHGTADEVTWGRVAAVYAVAGGLAVDSVCHGRVDLLQGVMEGMGEVLEAGNMGEWVAHNGGWPGLIHQCKFPETDVTYREYATIVVVAGVALIVVYVIISLLFKIGLF